VGSPESDCAELLTARFSLRRPTPADIDMIHSIHADDRACLHNPGDRLFSRAEAADLYHRWDEHWRRHGFGYRVIRPRRGRTVLGFCGVKIMRLRDRKVLNLFYRLDPTAWGDGVATEAARAVVARATAELPGQPVVARVRPANVASQRVATRVGLHRAVHLDSPGEDGLDWVFVPANWVEPVHWTTRRRRPTG
jgi:ribosomal-protein-alanine N-acetyltransferase